VTDRPYSRYHADTDVNQVIIIKIIRPNILLGTDVNEIGLLGFPDISPTVRKVNGRCARMPDDSPLG